MRKIFFIVVAALLFSAQQVLAEVNSTAIAVQPSFERQKETLRQLIEEKKYLQAQKLFEQLLKKKDLEYFQTKKLRSKYEQLNRQILFSKYLTPDSVTHEVVKGDSLSKIAKKYKVTPGLIKRSNSLKSDVVKLGAKLKIAQGDFKVYVDKSENILKLSFNGKPIKQYSVCTGKDNSTPIGKFKITDKLENPTWYMSGAVVPPNAPDNGLGTRWLGFDKKGYGIHGTNEPDSIGKQESHGCVRMLNKDVEELYALIPSGAEVTIVD